MADLILKLGDFVFSDSEIPEKIPFGGEQALVVHKLVGGGRVIDAMGRDDMALSWSGLLRGQNALQRARFLDTMRVEGRALKLTWHEFSYQVVIKSYHADFERFYKIPYQISCEVVADLASPETSLVSSGFDDHIMGDMTTANGLGVLIGDGPLSTALASLNTAIASVSSFATAVQSTINTVLTPLAAVMARVQILTGSVGNVIGNVTTIGGILPNNPIAQQASQLMGQVAAMNQLPHLYGLSSVLGRMNANLGMIHGGSKAVTVAGGNLFDLAAKQYGDATAWAGIARANNLTDPAISGIQTLNIPAQPDTSGGILTV